MTEAPRNLRHVRARALGPGSRAQLVLFIAATELVAEDLQREDAGRLRFASCHLALQALGIDDAGVERAKTQLRQGRDPETLNRRDN